MARSLYREWFVNFRFPGHEKVPLVDSPLGPIRLENGYILDPREGESTGGRWEFSMGTAF